MSKKSSALAAAGILAAAVVLSGFSIYKDSHQKNSTDGTITLRMAQTSSQTGAIGQAMDHFADRIYEETGGKYKIETYHNGQLGAEIDTIEGCQMGTIDIAVVNQSTIGNFISDFQALDIPYLITSTDQADAVFLGDIGTRFLDKLSGVQLYGLGIWESGFRNLTNSKRDINSVDDVSGLKIRTMENQVHIAFWKAMGADATPMSWGEAYTALQQGALDGQENPATVILTNNVAQVNNHLAMTEHAYSTVFLVMSPETWASFDDETKETFKRVMAECSIEEREISRKMDSEAVAELEKQGMKQLVIDLRSNPGGILDSAVAMVDYILPDDMKNFEKGNGKTLIVYTADKNGDGDTYTASDSHEVDMPIAILVNENSASASEVFTGALKDYKKAVVVGTTSYGKGIVQNLIPLGDGSAIKITTAHYYTPSGFDLHGKGIAPDVEVELDENLKSQAVVTPEEDNQVQAAVKALEKK